MIASYTAYRRQEWMVAIPERISTAYSPSFEKLRATNEAGSSNRRTLALGSNQSTASLNSPVDCPQKKVMKVQHFLQASSLIIGKHRHRSVYLYDASP